MRQENARFSSGNPAGKARAYDGFDFAVRGPRRRWHFDAR